MFNDLLLLENLHKNTIKPLYLSLEKITQKAVISVSPHSYISPSSLKLQRLRTRPHVIDIYF